MHFVFVDDTGDPGREVSKGASPHFGMALLSVKDNDYEAIRRLLSQVHWLSGTVSQIGLGRQPVRALSLLRGLKELARNGIVFASGIYITKENYGGRYLTWSDTDVPPSEWPYYLRNYLLRHLLEFHFSEVNTETESVDLVLDRVLLSESQRKNTLDYLNSRTAIPLKQSFAIPAISHLTIADSEYVGGLEVAHVLADILKKHSTETIPENIKEVSDFMRVKEFVGDQKAAE